MAATFVGGSVQETIALSGLDSVPMKACEINKIFEVIFTLLWRCQQENASQFQVRRAGLDHVRKEPIAKFMLSICVPTTPRVLDNKPVDYLSTALQVDT